MTFTKDTAAISYSQISLITSAVNIGLNDSFTVNVTVFVNGIEVACNIESNCSFNFSSDMVPIVTNVTPLNVSSSSVITIDGTQFGNVTKKLIVTIGSSNCNVTMATDSQIQCLLDSLKVGLQPVIVKLIGN